MNDKVCKDCKWCLIEEDYRRGGWLIRCCRYPEWIVIADGSRFHYCGEWKDKNDD